MQSVLIETNESFLSKLRKLLLKLIDYISDKSDNYIQELLKVKELIPWKLSSLRHIINMSLAKKYLCRCIQLTEDEQYIQALSMVNNCQEMCLDNLSNSKNEDEDELLDILDSANFYISRVQTFILITQAKKMLSEAFYEDDTINLELFYDILDKYREALNYNNINNERKDIELEAICYSELGFLLCTVLKSRERAKELLTHAVSLAMSLHPKNVHEERWYRKAVSCLTELRNYFVKQESEEEKKRKDNLKEGLKDTLEKLETEKGKGWESFVKFIKANHPPDDNSFDLKGALKAEIKKKSKILLKMIKGYHPDKVSNEDVKKKFLFEEITKILTSFYETAKNN
jgi:hypothetical protein